MTALKIARIPTTEDQLKVHALTLAVGSEIIQELNTAFAPGKIEDKSLDDLLLELRKRYGEAGTVIYHRAQLRQCFQKDGETISEFLLRIRDLARRCEFSKNSPMDALEEQCRDQFVAGVRNPGIQQNLLRQPKEMTLQQAEARALAVETAMKETNELSKSQEVNRTFQRPGSNKSGSSNCFRCGKSGHNPGACQHKDSVCNYCHKPGHIAPACYKKARATSRRPDDKSSDGSRKSPNGSKGKDSSRKVNDTTREPTESSDDDYSNQITNVHTVTVNQVKSRNKWYVDARINGHPITFEVDSGSEYTLVNEDAWRKLGSPKLSHGDTPATPKVSRDHVR